MKPTIEAGMLTINVYELIDELDDHELDAIADAVAVRDRVIKAVVQQVLDGWTDTMSHAGRECIAPAEPRTGLDWACREVAKRSGDVAASEIAGLERAVVYANKRIKELLEDLRKVRGY
jgi:hypothetical protein